MMKPSTLKRPKFRSLDEFASKVMQEFVSFLEAGEGSLDGGRVNMERALDAAIIVVYAFGTKHDWNAARILQKELEEIAAALRMATRGEKHPALQASKKSPSQRRGFSTDAQQLIKCCLEASDSLLRVGKSRTEADFEVVTRAKSAAQLAGIKLSATQLKHHRKKFRWLDYRPWWKPDLDRENAEIWKENSLRNIDLMTDRMRRRSRSDR